jgi:hypothetical protein
MFLRNVSWTTWRCIPENVALSVRIFFKTNIWVDIHFFRQKFVVAKGLNVSNTQGYIQYRCLLDVMPCIPVDYYLLQGRRVLRFSQR